LESLLPWDLEGGCCGDGEGLRDLGFVSGLGSAFLEFCGVTPSSFGSPVVVASRASDAALPYRTAARWVKFSREGRDAIQDSRRSGRPHIDNHTIQLLASLLDVDRPWAAWEIAAEVGICHKTVLHILHDILGYRKISARWVPHTMSEVQQWQSYA
jgi:hypothetical protein